jgi:GcrA cell cycle regulator
MTHTWTDERVALLSKLWAEGLSASQIAAELGGVTRNAVIGKVHRLGLSGRSKPASNSPKRAKRTRNTYNSKPRTAGTKTTPARVGGQASPKMVPQDLEEPVSKKLSLVELVENTCKWPDGDPATDDFHFCGNKTHEDNPYCEYHCRLAYQPQNDRRRDRQKVAAAG